MACSAALQLSEVTVAAPRHGRRHLMHTLSSSIYSCVSTCVPHVMPVFPPEKSNSSSFFSSLSLFFLISGICWLYIFLSSHSSKSTVCEELNLHLKPIHQAPQQSLSHIVHPKKQTAGTFHVLHGRAEAETGVVWFSFCSFIYKKQCWGAAWDMSGSIVPGMEHLLALQIMLAC